MDCRGVGVESLERNDETKFALMRLGVGVPGAEGGAREEARVALGVPALEVDEIDEGTNDQPKSAVRAAVSITLSSTIVRCCESAAAPLLPMDWTASLSFSSFIGAAKRTPARVVMKF